MTTADQIAAAEKNLDRLLDWVATCDNKTVIILGIDTALAGVFARILALVSVWTCLNKVVALVTVMLLIFEFGCLFVANIPRTKGPEGSSSLLFFGGIAERGLDEYRNAFTRQTQDEYLLDLLSQCHRNAEIVSIKFRCLISAYRILVPLLGFWALSLYLLRS
jgi:hypothetical protein